MEHFSQSPGFELGERRAGLQRPVMMGWPLLGALRWMLAVGEWCDLDLRIPVSLNRRFTYMVRVASVKMPRLLAFARHVEDSHYWAQKPRMQHLWEAGHYSTGTQNLEKNSPCNVEDNLRAGLIVIEAWLGGY